MASLLSWLHKIRDGILFQETFENANFAQADGWVALQGVAANTPQQAKAGIRSLKLAGQATPIIWRAISDSDVGTEIAEVWYYDTMDAILPGPFFKVKISDGTYYQFGVRNAVSAVNYSYNDTAVEDAFVATAVARTLGWHRFRVMIPRTGNAVGYIDSTLIFTTPVTALSSVTDLKLQADVAGSALESFGYFDEVRIFRDTFCRVTGVGGRQVVIRDANELLVLAVQNLLGTADADFPLTAPLDVWPQSYCFQASQQIEADFSTSNWYALAHRSPFLDISPGDWYQFREINFGNRRVNLHKLTPSGLMNKNTATTGRTEVLAYGFKDKYQMTVSALSGDAMLAAVRDLHEHLRLGEPCFFMLWDSQPDFYTINVTAYAGTKDIGVQSQFGPPLSTISTDRYYLIVKKDRSARQVVRPAILYPGLSITLNEYLAFQVDPGDYFLGLGVLPFLEMETTDLGYNLTDPGNERYNWVQNFREWVP